MIVAVGVVAACCGFAVGVWYGMRRMAEHMRAQLPVIVAGLTEGQLLDLAKQVRVARGVRDEPEDGG